MNHLAITISGIVGNIISCMVIVAPVATFRQICRDKSTGGFSSVPYVVAFLSSALWILYAQVKGGSALLLAINAICCCAEAGYIVVYLVYAPRKERLRTVAYVLLFDMAAFAVIVVLTLKAVAVPHRVKFLGVVCLTFSLAVFVAPLTVIVKVVRTKSVEFLPIGLSVCLVLSAVVWFLYGLFTKDHYVMYPNVGGFFFSCVQIGLYFWYRGPKKAELPTKTGGAAQAAQRELVDLPSRRSDEITEIVPAV